LKIKKETPNNKEAPKDETLKDNLST